ncbi:hypothetical protein FQN57_002732 [Myotisia sp. PD_48]|nr:hypothetical protein FQN57_002732 [Myotisia sp. PD_48]
MTEPEDLDEDLFADLYDAEEPTTTQAPAPVPVPVQPVQEEPPKKQEVPPDTRTFAEMFGPPNGAGASQQPPHQQHQQQQQYNGTVRDVRKPEPYQDGGNIHPEAENQGTGIKEDGKMFIGGLNWETTDQSLKDYFSQFGEVLECTVMRDGSTGRSRGFGFLTFVDPKTVNTVMVKEHYLDGKIIDPKRAIPRDEQERTSKIFVGGVSQEATEQDFKQFFMQFGRVVDATLMIDKDTGRPRGFGFVTFDSEAAVEATLSGPLEIHGKPIEVKKAQPRGNLRDDDAGGKGGRRGFRDGGYKDGDRSSGNDSAQQNAQAQGAMAAGMTPQMMAQYWQRMQQYFALMKQQMAATTGQGQMGGLNPALLQQMQQMQQANPQQQQGGMSPAPQQGMMNPAMMQQMQQIQHMQQQQMNQMPNQAQGGQGYPGGGGSVGGGMANQMGGGMPANVPAAASTNNMGMGGGNYNGNRSGPGYTAHEQLAFEQQKYEQQQARRGVDPRTYPGYQQGNPTSWEGMYDDNPQPNIPAGPQGMSRGSSMSRVMSPNQSIPTLSKPGQPNSNPQTPSAPPANAPTGPRNAGRPGANYRGGGRGAHRGFHPYSRGQ